MNAARPIIKQLDHLIVRVDDPQAVFHFFTEILQLPVAWPLKSYPAFMSGGVVLGNVNLEILQCGPQRKRSGNGSQRARFCAVAFEAEDLSETVKELARRGIPHTPLIPYVQKDEGAGKVHLWSNVVLGRLLGSSFWVNANVFMSHLPGAAMIANAGSGNPFMKWGFDKFFSETMVFLVKFEYENFVDLPHWSEFENHDEKRASDLAALRAREGGALGLERVKQIVCGVNNFAEAQELWRKLFAPVSETGPGIWEITDGPSVRLLAATENSIQTVVLEVYALERAETFLGAKGMLENVSEGRIRIAPQSIDGLHIELVQS